MKIQIKTMFGKLIFEYEKENNTIKETLKEYIRVELEKGYRYANLSSADLRYANLSSADLRSADLRYADLSYANLSSANLRSANLSYADLSSANLRSADLSYADLSSANLRSADLDKRYLQVSCIGSAKRMTTYCFDDDVIWCGCFKGTLKEFEKQVKETHKENALYMKEYLGFIKYVESLK